MRPATTKELELAREQCECDDVQFDDDARVATIEDSDNIWVQAWFRVEIP